MSDNNNNAAPPPSPAAPIRPSDPHAASSPPLTPDQSPPPPNTSAASSSFPTTADFFALSPAEALKLLSTLVEALVRVTGDVPPTPPPKDPQVPNMRSLQAEKERLARSHSEKNLARARTQAEERERTRPTTATIMTTATGFSPPPETSSGGHGEAADKNSGRRHDDACQTRDGGPGGHAGTATGIGPLAITPVDGVRLRDAVVSPVSPSSAATTVGPLSPYIVIGADSEPLNLQHSAITRKFFSKNEPPISITGYLQRMHQYCPMSTAVYLATSLYIHRLTVVERAIPITRRNAHRLILASLRVAMKALEDLSYPHAKMAKVGGVSAAELARLEISFCFLAGFELVVGEHTLKKHWTELRTGRAVPGMGGDGNRNGRGFNLAAMAIPTGRIKRRDGGGRNL